MRDLAAYQPVSSMPPVARDLSVAVAADEDEETLGDRVRELVAAGFTIDDLVAEDDKLLASATDDHTANVFTPAVRGKTDQFILKFRKPKK